MTAATFTPAPTTSAAPSASPAEQFRAIFERYERRICRFLYGKCENWHLAEDLTEDVFAELWTMLCAGRVTGEVGSMFSLLAKMGQYRLFNHWKVAAVQREQALAPADFHEDKTIRLADPSVGLDETVAERVSLGAALALLSPEQRRAVSLHFLADLPTSDVAALTKVSSRTVYNRLDEAKALLREHYGLAPAAKPADQVKARREAATEAYRASVAAGSPLGPTLLGRQFGASYKWAEEIIRASGVRPPVAEYEGPKVVMRLRTRLIEGGFKVGEPLPSAAALAPEFGTTESMMYRAMVKLVTEGVLQRTGARGGPLAKFVPAAIPAAVEAEPVRVPLRARVLMQLRERLYGGAFPADCPLPTGAALAAELGTNRQDVRRALHALVAEGLVRREGTAHGRGAKFYPAASGPRLALAGA